MPALAAIPLLDQKADHTHAVLDLRVRAVMLSRWEFTTCQVVPFIRKKDEWVALWMLCLKATLVGLDLLNNRPGLLAGVVTQWRQVAGLNHVVIFGQTHRHHRDRFDDRS